MDLEVTGVDHIYVTVTDLVRAEPIGGERHVHYFNPVTQYTIRAAKSLNRVHDSYSPGLHHICFRVKSSADVDAAARGLRGIGIATTDPSYYAEYAPDYYAT